MRSLIAASLLASALVAAPAFAQDAAPAPAPQDMPATPVATSDTSSTSTNGTSFRGFRVEGNFGGDRFQSQGIHNDKFGYGASVGFDGQIGDRIVIGPEATYWRANNWNENCSAASGGNVCEKSFEEVGAGVRAGVLVAPQLLIFGKGGYVSNEQRKRFTTPTGRGSYYDHYNTDGYQVGGGFELSMANRFQGPLSGLILSGQYVFSQYDDHTSRQRVMGGVGLRFR